MPAGGGGGLQRLQKALQRDVGEELSQGVPAPAVGRGDGSGRGGGVSAGQGTSVWWPGHIWKEIYRRMGSWLSITHRRWTRLGAVLFKKQLHWSTRGSWGHLGAKLWLWPQLGGFPFSLCRVSFPWHNRDGGHGCVLVGHRDEVGLCSWRLFAGT